MGQAEDLTREIEQLARQAGADLVGFADVEGLAELPRAVAFAIRHDPSVLRTADGMPNPEYHGEYVDFNERLTEIAEKIAALLQERGWPRLSSTRRRPPGRDWDGSASARCW